MGILQKPLGNKAKQHATVPPYLASHRHPFLLPQIKKHLNLLSTDRPKIALERSYVNGCKGSAIAFRNPDVILKQGFGVFRGNPVESGIPMLGMPSAFWGGAAARPRHADFLR